MGKQVRFFNYPADVTALDAFLGDCGASIVLDSGPTRAPLRLPHLPQDGVTMSGLLLVRSSDLVNLQWQHLPSRGLWTVDKHSSHVVEYTPGYDREGQPRFVSSRGPGRMWFQTSRWVEDQLVEADADFTGWADRIFRWVKKQWVLIDSDYYSPAAAERWKTIWHVVVDEPYEGAAADQIGRWRRQNDPSNELASGSVHTSISRATRDRPRRLTIAIRADNP